MNQLDHRAIKEEVESKLPKVGTSGFAELPVNGKQDIMAGISLTDNQQKIAWMDASGMPIWAIEQALGLDAGSVSTLRADKDYRTLIDRCVRLRAQAVVGEAKGDIEGLLESEIGNSIVALMEVRHNPYEKGANRIKAAESMLDRTPKAPKAKREVEERKTIIAIPVRDLQVMQQALIEEGTTDDAEIVDLLKGVDFDTVEDGGEGNGKEGIEIKEF